MSRLVVSSDLHLGHKNITKYRTQFSSMEEHDEYVISRHKETIRKNDVWYCLGDCAFTKEKLIRLKEIRCVRKVLLLGNHDLENEVTLDDLKEVFDAIESLKPHKCYNQKIWFSHCPIHPDEMRKKNFNIHGHTHNHVLEDPRYINACVEHTDFGVVPVQHLLNDRAKTLWYLNHNLYTLQSAEPMVMWVLKASGMLLSILWKKSKKRFLKPGLKTITGNVSSVVTWVKTLLISKHKE